MNEIHFSFLMRGPKKIAEDNPVDWLPNSAWQENDVFCQRRGNGTVYHGGRGMHRILCFNKRREGGDSGMYIYPL